MYNGLLSLYKEKGKVVSYKEVYNEENTWLLDADTSSYSNIQINLKKAIKNYISNSKHFGEPKYRYKHNKKQSYTTSVTNNNSRVIDNRHIRIPKIGIIKAIVHKSIPDDYKLKSVTISRECNNKYYASLLYEYELVGDNQTNNDFSIITGMDYSQEHLGVLSNCCGNVNNNLRLETRVYDCECGNHIDRDVNAALNLVIEEIRILGEPTI